MILSAILDFIWPRNCAVCNRPVDRPDRLICSECIMRLPFVPTTGLCRMCGRDAASFDRDFLCDDCRSRGTKPHFDRAACAMRFEGEGRELINSFKFRGRTELKRDLVDFLEATVRARFKVEEIEAVVPMPSTLLHRWLRGYNQCGMLAKALGKRLNKPVKWLLRRKGSPKRQGGLKEEARRKNVIGTFQAVKNKLPYSTVLVVDDIMTTGSTLSESAKTLKAAGVKKVFTVALARSIR